MAEEDPHPEAPSQDPAAMETSGDTNDTKSEPMQCNQPPANPEAMLANSADDLHAQKDGLPQSASDAGNNVSLSDELEKRKHELLHRIDSSSATNTATSANSADELERKKQELLDRLTRLSPDAMVTPTAADELHDMRDTRSDHPQPHITVPRLVGEAPSYPYRDRSSKELPSKLLRYLEAQKTAAWSPDGRCVLTSGNDDCLTTTLLFYNNKPPAPAIITRYQAPGNITAFAPLPCFHTEQGESMLVLLSSADVPTRLFNVNEPDKRMASYPLMWDTDDLTQLRVRGIKFKPCGQQFICAGDRSIAIFDINRTNQGPLMHERTVPDGNRKRKRSRWGPKPLSGNISDIDYNCQGVLAVGTYSRSLGFYDDFGAGEAIWVLNLADLYQTPATSRNEGIMWVRWSPDGNYLYVAERNSDDVLVIDIRMPNRTASILTGRHALSTQRLGFDLIYNEYGHHVVAGGSDGVVRVWENPSTCNGEFQRPDLEWKAHDTAVASVLQNPCYQDDFVTITGEIEHTTEEDYDSSNDSESTRSLGSEVGKEDTSEMEVEEDEDDEEGSSSDESSDEESSSSDESSDDEPQDRPACMTPQGWMKVWQLST